MPVDVITSYSIHYTKLYEKLKVRSDRTKVYNLKSYYTVITAVKDYQVLRHFVVFADFRIGRPAQYSIREVVQRWLTPKGKINTLA